jgi:hypothetical protein
MGIPPRGNPNETSRSSRGPPHSAHRAADGVLTASDCPPNAYDVGQLHSRSFCDLPTRRRRRLCYAEGGERAIVLDPQPAAGSRGGSAPPHRLGIDDGGSPFDELHEVLDDTSSHRSLRPQGQTARTAQDVVLNQMSLSAPEDATSGRNPRQLRLQVVAGRRIPTGRATMPGASRN